ncbi:hypothetical protein ACOSQ3_019975 [Xanthoceras sorbifolium]
MEIAVVKCTEKIITTHDGDQAVRRNDFSNRDQVVGPIDCMSDDKIFVYTDNTNSSDNTVMALLRTRRIVIEWRALDGCSDSEKSGNFCGFNSTINSTVLLIVYKSRKSDKKKETQLKVEKFLEDYKILNPARYTYSELKKITGKFKHKLGQGGYGSVYKGKLSNGIPVAVKKLQKIAIGVARGIDYLHRGCKQRILHFNIKPHNILLDHNFQPKISDFGMDKLFVRGTDAYIVPELYSRNFGKVSYKSDVFSYGTMLLEMVGCRSNTDLTIENQSQVHFPKWIYNKMSLGRVISLGIEEDGDEEIAKMLAIVGPWCIQWNSTDRPSMTMVIQMLEGDLQSLEIPPKPFVSSDVEMGEIS